MIVKYRLVQLQPKNISNVSIDSLYISKTNVETLELTVNISNQGNPIENLSISLLENDQLIAKSAVAIITNAETIFTIPNSKAFKGKITIDDPNLSYDNTFYFHLDKKEHIKVLVVNAANADFLRKLFTDDEFELKIVDFQELNLQSAI